MGREQDLQEIYNKFEKVERLKRKCKEAEDALTALRDETARAMISVYQEIKQFDENHDYWPKALNEQLKALIRDHKTDRGIIDLHEDIISPEDDKCD